jgi:hypothetical protein
VEAGCERYGHSTGESEKEAELTEEPMTPKSLDEPQAA